MNNYQLSIKNYQFYKDSGVEWIGEIPEHWEVKHLKNIVSVKITDGPHETPVFTDDGIPFISAEAIQNGGVNFDSKRGYISKETDGIYSLKCKPRKNDIFIVKSGSTTGKIGYVSTDINFNIWSPLALVRANKVNYSRHLFYFLSSSFFQRQVQMYWSLGTQPNIGMKVLENLQVVIPPLPEQKSIALYLDTKTAQINRKIDLLTQKAKRYEELKRSLINETVIGKRGIDNGELRIDNGKREDKNCQFSIKNYPLYKDSAIEWIGEVPEHWQLKRLKDIGTSIIGITYAPEDALGDKTSGLLVLRSSNIQNGQLSLSDTVYVNKKVNPRQIVKKGDILICSRNGSRALIGKNICIDEKTEGQTFGAFMTVYRSKYFRFISKFFNSNVFESQSGLFGSSTINQLTVNTLNNFLVILPPLSEQKTIAHYLATKTAHIDLIIQTINTQIEKLKELRKTLINDVVTGKIKVIDNG